MLQRSVSAPLGRSISNSTIGTIGSSDFDFEDTKFAHRALSRLPPTFSREASQKIRTNGVVKIYNNSARWNLEKPWTIDNEDWSGSGFIIEGRIIATNAHVADGAKMLTLRKQADCQRYPARVLAIAHQVDIAFLTVDDEEFWSNAVELEITKELVSFQDEVHVIGYPTGGDSVCVTVGVVSRIDWIEYCQSSTSNLCIQVDAAINPGNSGGPCLFEGKVCGVAFQGRMFAQSIGYIIPSSILIKMVGEVKTLLDERGPPHSVVTLRKFGQFPATFQPVENPYMRRFANLPAGTTGVLINKVQKFGWLNVVLKVGDILIAIDDNPIGNDAKVAMPGMDGGRVDFRILVTSKLVGEEIKISMYREGSPLSCTINVGDENTMVPYQPIEGAFYMFAGFVMVPNSKELENSMKYCGHFADGDEDNGNDAPDKITQTVPYQQSIVVSVILPHEINQGHKEQVKPLDQVQFLNDTPIYHMNDLVETIEKLKAERVPWVIIKLLNGKQFAFPLDEAVAATEELKVDNNMIKLWDKIEKP